MSEYLRDCLDGRVYDRVVELTGYDRDDVKRLFLAVIYGEPRDMGTKVGNAIHRLYPAVFDAVAALNHQLGHGGLPRLMQRIESGVMIGRVAGRLVRERKGMPLLTIHDSVLVPEEHAGPVEGVIAEEWRAEFGVAPRLKLSEFTAPQRPRGKRHAPVTPLSRSERDICPVLVPDEVGQLSRPGRDKPRRRRRGASEDADVDAVRSA